MRNYVVFYFFFINDFIYLGERENVHAWEEEQRKRDKQTLH